MPTFSPPLRQHRQNRRTRNFRRLLRGWIKTAFGGRRVTFKSVSRSTPWTWLNASNVFNPTQWSEGQSRVALQELAGNIVREISLLYCSKVFQLSSTFKTFANILLGYSTIRREFYRCCSKLKFYTTPWVTTIHRICWNSAAVLQNSADVDFAKNSSRNSSRSRFIQVTNSTEPQVLAITGWNVADEADRRLGWIDEPPGRDRGEKIGKFWTGSFKIHFVFRFRMRNSNISEKYYV